MMKISTGKHIGGPARAMTKLFGISSDDDPDNSTTHVTASPLGGQDVQLPAVRVPIRSLFPSDSPRLCGENAEHGRTLAESEAALPPIIVHRATMRVVDGMHRLRAATLRGQDYIDVQFFDGDVHDAFVLAVKANITHGLPLSLADRTAAAERIIGSHPRWSDRAIASTVGLAAKTVAEIRRRSTAEDPQLNTRIGRDGRVRPLSTAEGRRLASELIANRPNASLREIASAAGISLGTAQDVRERLRQGENPIPATQYNDNHTRVRPTGDNPPNQRTNRPAPRTPVTDRVAILDTLKKDPSLRLAHTGRVLLRLFHILTITTTEWDQLITTIPAHCKPTATDAARACAQAWQEFAEQLERH